MIVAFQGREPLYGGLYARITYFHRSPTTQDVDNIIKPILDASAGVDLLADTTVQHITYIEIGQAPGQRISFGPIEGHQL